jgi:hypothetical protein
MTIVLIILSFLLGVVSTLRWCLWRTRKSLDAGMKSHLSRNYSRETWTPGYDVPVKW